MRRYAKHADNALLKKEIEMELNESEDDFIYDIGYDNGEPVYYIDDVEVTEYDFYEELSKVIERERQEDAMDAAQAMEEAEMRDEYYRDMEVD
jgi:hypothetical protein